MVNLLLVFWYFGILEFKKKEKTMKRICIFLLLFASFCLFAAYDNVYTVKLDGTGNFTDIRSAVNACTTSAYILVYGPGTYNGTNNRNISWYGDHKTISLRGINNPVIDCSNSGRAFKITDGSNDDIVRGFTITNARCSECDGGAIYIDRGSPKIYENTFQYCSTGVFPTSYNPKVGGAIYMQNCNGAIIIDNDFNSNVAFSGGAIYAINCNFTIENNNFSNNSSGHYTYGTGNTGPAGTVHLIDCSDVTVTNNKFIGNSANAGAVALLFGDSDGKISYNEFTNNVFGELDANVGYLNSIVGVHGSVEITNNLFTDNHSDSFMESTLYCSGTLTIRNNSFIDNEDDFSPLFINNANNETIENCIFANNDSYCICDDSEITLNYCLTYQSGSTGSTSIGTGCLLNSNPNLDSNYEPQWNSTTKSCVIDAGNPSITDDDDTPSDIGAITAIDHTIYTTQLPSPSQNNGWKWLSLPVLDDVLSNADMASNVLSDILSTSILDTVLTNGDDIYYYHPDWFNTSQTMYKTSGYKFKMNSSANLETIGFKENETSSVYLNGIGDENWVGYFLEDTQTVQQAFSNYWNDDNIFYIKNQFWTAIKISGVWNLPKGILNINYGDMVVIKCNTDISNFRWLSGIQSLASNPTPIPQYFTYEEDADYIPIFVELDDENLPSEIGVIVDGECIGATVVEDTLVQIRAYAESVSEGDIELQLHYGTRESDISLRKYSCYNSEKPEIKQTMISTASKADTWFIDLKNNNENTPYMIKFNSTNYPNPFNPTTTISYSIPNDGYVEITIYNTKGQEVETLVNKFHNTGTYSVIWDGKNSAGQSVSSGIYFYKVKSGANSIINKILLVK